MKKITKREAWSLIQKDKFLTMLAKQFGCQGFQQNGKRYVK